MGDGPQISREYVLDELEKEGLGDVIKSFSESKQDDEVNQDDFLRLINCTS